jgi:hypothetical protein
VKKLVSSLVFVTASVVAAHASAEVHTLRVHTTNGLSGKSINWPDKTDFLTDSKSQGTGSDPSHFLNTGTVKGTTGGLSVAVGVFQNGTSGGISVSDWVPDAQIRESFESEGLGSIRASVEFDLQGAIAGLAENLPNARIGARVSIGECVMNISKLLLRGSNGELEPNPNCLERPDQFAKAEGNTIVVQVPEPDRPSTMEVRAIVYAELHGAFGGQGSVELQLSGKLTVTSSKGKITFATPTFLSENQLPPQDGGASASDGGGGGPTTVPSSDGGNLTISQNGSTPLPAGSSDDSSCAMSVGHAGGAGSALSLFGLALLVRRKRAKVAVGHDRA